MAIEKKEVINKDNAAPINPFQGISKKFNPERTKMNIKPKNISTFGFPLPVITEFKVDEIIKKVDAIIKILNNGPPSIKFFE